MLFSSLRYNNWKSINSPFYRSNRVNPLQSIFDNLLLNYFILKQFFLQNLFHQKSIIFNLLPYFSKNLWKNLKPLSHQINGGAPVQMLLHRNRPLSGFHWVQKKKQANDAPLWVKLVLFQSKLSEKIRHSSLKFWPKFKIQTAQALSKMQTKNQQKPSTKILDKSIENCFKSTNCLKIALYDYLGRLIRD